MQRSILRELVTHGLVDVEAVVARRSAAPRSSGLYAWWIESGALNIVGYDAINRDGLTLGYVGIAPRKPSASGCESRSTLRSRLRQHCRGPIASSTLRRTFAALLQGDLRLSCKRSTSGKLVLENDGERALSAWIAEYARVSWIEHPAPWTLETALLQSDLRLPLNIQGRAAASTSLIARRKGLG